MIRNYLKIAWRNIVADKAYSILNIAGLAIGMAVAILIGTWVHHEYSYDKFLPGYQQAYKVRRNFNSNGDTLNFSTMSLRLADALRSVPGIDHVAETSWESSHGLMGGDNKKLYITGIIAGADFLKIFPFALLNGNAGSVLNDPYSIVLTESTARSLFGNADPIGKMVRFDNIHDLKVSGLLKDLPSNSSFTFNYIVPFQFLELTYPYMKGQHRSFDNNAYQVFVKIHDAASYDRVSSLIRDIEHSESKGFTGPRSNVILQPLQNWHLYSKYENGKETGGFLTYVRMFTLIGVLVLLIACINFINLITARSERRAKEVGIRKAIGSLRKDLIIQFMLESFLFSLIAFAAALILVQSVLPFFNLLIKQPIDSPLTSPIFWLTTPVALLLTTLLAGARPAFFLSSFQPVKVLKGNRGSGNGGSLPRRVLVVLQFTCSIALIISTIVVYRQIQFAKDRPTGYSIDRLVMTDVNEDMERNFSPLTRAMMESGAVSDVSSASSPITQTNWHATLDQWPGKKANESVEMAQIIVSDNYFKTVGIQMASGRVFSEPSDTLSAIFNEAAIKTLRIKEPLNQVVTRFGQQYRIIGVAKDALMVSPFEPADPTMFVYDPHPQGELLYRLSDRVSTGDAISRLSALFRQYNPAFPYIYTFVDESYGEKFSEELLIGHLAALFAGLAIFISCLGLFGLAAYTARQRTKEIGIRKVLGASLAQVWLLLCKDFIVLILLSCVIASPLAFYALNNWLSHYSYHIRIGWSVYAFAAIGALVITILTISFQAIKAGVANPTESLKMD